MSALERLWRRVWNMLAVGSIGTVDDTGTAQRAQVKLGYLETVPAASVVQQFGLASVPPPGTDAVVIFLAGNRASGVVIGTNNQSLRPTGQNPGETTLFNAFSMSVALTESGIVISGGGKPVTVTNGDLHAGNIVATGTVAVTGEITVNGTTLAVP